VPCSPPILGIGIRLNSGGYLRTDWLAHTDSAREFDDYVEEYTGLATAQQGPNDGLQVDSVIHALGRQRSAFMDRMARRPEIVVTTAPDYGTWPSWGVSANWWFYRGLFAGYLPQRTSPSTVVWRRNQPVDWEPVSCRVVDSAVLLQAPEAGLYDVTIYYAGPGRNARAFTMLRNNINRAADANGYVALDPGATSQRVPVSVPMPGEVVLDTLDRPATGTSHTELRGCVAHRVTAPAGAETLRLYASLLGLPSESVNENH
jgi:hypothetical protein